MKPFFLWNPTHINVENKNLLPMELHPGQEISVSNPEALRLPFPITSPSLPPARVNHSFDL